MSERINASICLTDLGDKARANHSAITTGKNGKKYANITIWINDEKDKFYRKFLPFFTEIVLQKQIEESGVDNADFDKIELDRDIFSVEIHKIMKIFDIIYHKIGKIIVNSTENKDENIKNIKNIYSELNNSLEMNLKRFIDQINVNSGR
jgi:hypothetical protein